MRIACKLLEVLFAICAGTGLIMFIAVFIFLIIIWADKGAIYYAYCPPNSMLCDR